MVKFRTSTCVVWCFYTLNKLFYRLDNGCISVEAGMMYGDLLGMTTVTLAVVKLV